MEMAKRKTLTAMAVEIGAVTNKAELEKLLEIIETSYKLKFGSRRRPSKSKPVTSEQ